MGKTEKNGQRNKWLEEIRAKEFVPPCTMLTLTQWGFLKLGTWWIFQRVRVCMSLWKTLSRIEKLHLGQDPGQPMRASAQSCESDFH